MGYEKGKAEYTPRIISNEGKLTDIYVPKDADAKNRFPENVKYNNDMMKVERIIARKKLLSTLERLIEKLSDVRE